MVCMARELLIVLSNISILVGVADLRAFITPYLRQGHLLEVAAIATRIVSSWRTNPIVSDYMQQFRLSTSG
jgi:hypothetical protein